MTGVMDAAIARRIERNVDRGASALFAGAAAYCTYGALSPIIAQPILGAYCGGAAALAYVLTVRGLILMGAGQQRHPVPVFDLRKIDPMPPMPSMPAEELILTDADRVAVAQPDIATPALDELVLDDIVADLEPDSRIVRLFDRQAMPSPGQLKQQIDQHLAATDAPVESGREEGGPEESSDASQALSDALSELRRSLR
jgi:hypothetical protein